MQFINLSWAICRNIARKRIFVYTPNLVPGWTSFHCTISTVESVPTVIGYCRSIPQPITDSNVVLTMLMSLAKISQKVGQQTTIVTLDESTYAPAKKSQWQMSPRLDNFVIRLGGFHTAKKLSSCHRKICGREWF